MTSSPKHEGRGRKEGLTHFVTNTNEIRIEKSSKLLSNTRLQSNLGDGDLLSEGAGDALHTSEQN